MERSVTQPKLPPSDDVDDRQDVQQLYTTLRASLPELEKLLRDCQSHWGYEDGVYRFYHHSFKVYSLQETTSAIVAALQSLASERNLNESFMAIVRDGTGKTFEREHNRHGSRSRGPSLKRFSTHTTSSKWPSATGSSCSTRRGSFQAVGQPSSTSTTCGCPH